MDALEDRLREILAQHYSPDEVERYALFGLAVVAAQIGAELRERDLRALLVAQVREAYNDGRYMGRREARRQACS